MIGYKYLFYSILDLEPQGNMHYACFSNILSALFKPAVIPGLPASCSDQMKVLYFMDSATVKHDNKEYRKWIISLYRKVSLY